MKHGADYSVRIIGSLIRFVEDKLGRDELRAIANESDIDESMLSATKPTAWISSEQFERFLAALRSRLPSDEAFKEACTYRLADGYGPIVHVLWAASPAALYGLTTKTYGLVARVGRCEILESGRTWSHMRITSDRPFSRLVCLVRQAQTAALPTLWGLPPANLREDGCVGFGHEACNFHFTWFDTRRWFPVVLGALAGATAMFLLPGIHKWSVLLLGATLGFVYEFLRTDRTNLAKRTEMIAALRTVAAEEVEARREIQEFDARQREWTRMLAESEADRAARVKSVIEKIDEEQQARVTHIRGVSHDLKSPLNVVIAGTHYLRELRQGEEEREVFDEIEAAAWRMNALIMDLMSVAAPVRAVKMTTEPLAVASLIETVRRRLRALVHGRDIRVSAFLTREAPTEIQTNVMVLDRILDNIFGNAAKYTERGSILFEAAGTDDTLTFKISDTGRGIAPGDMMACFTPEGSDPTHRAAGSHGLGLSVVIELLWQLGGRLEVMSRPGSGTTFWVSVPVAGPPPQSSQGEGRNVSYEQILKQVLRVRTQVGDAPDTALLPRAQAAARQ